MKLASSSYYYKPITDPSELSCSDAELRDHIERLQGEFAGYGYRRLGKQLRREGICVNDKRIRRVQRKYQLFPIRWQSFKIATTDSNHGHRVYRNLLAELTVTVCRSCHCDCFSRAQSMYQRRAGAGYRLTHRSCRRNRTRDEQRRREESLAVVGALHRVVDLILR